MSSYRERLRQEISMALADWAIDYGVTYKEVIEVARTTMDYIEVNSEN